MVFNIFSTWFLDIRIYQLVCVYKFNGKGWQGESLVNIVNRLSFAKLNHPNYVVLTIISNLMAELLIHQTNTQIHQAFSLPNFPTSYSYMVMVYKHNDIFIPKLIKLMICSMYVSTLNAILSSIIKKSLTVKVESNP